MKLLYIPLDERPCNVFYPQMIAELQVDVELRVPPLDLLGEKKRSADLERLWDWVFDHVVGCQVALLSIEMLMYGGLLPSRLHQDSLATLTQRLHRLRKLKEEYPEVKIFASNLVMRTPRYSSSEEEPDYYATHGEHLFNWGWLQDKSQRLGLSADEQMQLAQVQAELPSEYLEDYQARRACNVAVNLAVLTLVQEGIISFLSIPQDDSAPYGFTAMDQQQIVDQVMALRLQSRVHLYPGADEVGCTLLARAYNQLCHCAPKIYVFYSSVCSPQTVPLYEDRPLGESIKAHILAVGAQSVSTPEAADVIFAVNTAGQVMQEAWDQSTKDITYSSFRSLRCFVAELERWLGSGKQVAIADVAFANGGETELVQMLDDAALWDKLLAYAGWNTSCNTLGTVLATLSLGLEAPNGQAVAFNKMYRLLEDWCYQSIVRAETLETYLPTVGASYYDFNDQEDLITQTIATRLLALWQETLRQSFTQWNIQQLIVFSPWHRMFEVGLQLKITPSPG